MFVFIEIILNYRINIGIKEFTVHSLYKIVISSLILGSGTIQALFVKTCIIFGCVYIFPHRQ